MSEQHSEVEPQRVEEARREQRDEVGMGLMLMVVGGGLSASPWLVPGASHGFDAGTGLALVIGVAMALIGMVRLARAVRALRTGVVPEPATARASRDEALDRSAI